MAWLPTFHRPYGPAVWDSAVAWDEVVGETGVLDLAYMPGDARRYGITADGTTDWEGSYASRVAAWLASGLLAGVVATLPAGVYNTSLNLSGTYSGIKMHFEPGAILRGIFHCVGTITSPMVGCRFTGEISTYDRFGSIYLRDSYIEAIRILSDAALGVYGRARGVHLYSGTDNNRFDRIVIDDCSVTNGDAAFALDGAGAEPSRNSFGVVRIKDSDVHGVLINGRDNTVETLIVEAWGAGAYTGSGAQHSSGSTETALLSGAWFGVCPGLTIGRLIVDQSTAPLVHHCQTTNTSTTIGTRTDNRFTRDAMAGMTVSGTGIAASTTVSAVVSDTRITLSQAATATGLDVSLTFGHACTTTNTSTTVACAGATLSKLRVGQTVAGTGIPAATTVVSIASDYLTMVISAAATATGASTVTATRTNATYHARFDDSDIYPGTGANLSGTINVGSFRALNVQGRGIAISDAVYPCLTCSVAVGEAHITPAWNTALTSGYAMLTVYAPTALVTKFMAGTIRFGETYGNPCFNTKASTDIAVDQIDNRRATGNASSITGYAVLIEGTGSIGSIDHYTTGASSSSVTPITVQATADVKIGRISCDVPSLTTITAILFQTTSRLSVGPIYSNNFRGQPAVNLLTLTDSQIGPINAVETGATGWGVRFNACTRTTINGGKVTGFAVGYKSGGALTDCVVIDATATSNTSNTDLTPAGLTLVGQCAGLRQAANNVLSGPNAGDALTAGDGNVLFGLRAGRLQTTASYNTFIGYDTGRGSVTGGYNVGIGYTALFAMTAATGIVAIGNAAGYALTDFADAVLIGRQTGMTITTATGRTRSDAPIFIGPQAGKWHNEGANIGIGDGAVGGGLGSATGATGYGNVGLGSDALTLLTQGAHNTAIGDNAGKAITTGGSNTMVGRSAGNGATTGGFNVLVGHAAAYYQTTGDSNTYVGNLAGSPSIAGNPARTGSTNTGIGEGAGPSVESLSATVCVGAGATTGLASTGKFGSGLTSTTVSGNLFNSATVSDINNAAGVTLTAAQLLGGYITRSGAVAVSDTTPTAAQIVAAIPGCEVGTSREIKIVSANSGLLTIAAGSGVTLAGTTTVAATFTRTYLVRVTNATAASEAVTILGVSTAAN